MIHCLIKYVWLQDSLYVLSALFYRWALRLDRDITRGYGPAKRQ